MNDPLHTNPKTLDRYGCRKTLANQFQYDCWAFANYFSGQVGAPARLALFQRIADTLAPGWFEWHDWALKMIGMLCRRRWGAVTGCSNSSKTRNAAGYACVWWLCSPDDSSVIFCSTTMKMLRKRGWSEVQNFYNAIGGDFGNFVDSRTIWQSRQGDDLHAIFAIAVQEGDVNKTAANIQGMHTRRQLAFIDEAEAVPGAIWKAAANLYSYPVDAGGEFTFCAIANPRSRLSAFGRYIEPAGGWDAVSIETEEWESKPQLDGKKAAVVRLDFLKSPNVLGSKVVSKHLPNKQRVSLRMAALKAKGAENDPDHWCYDRGFPPPEGLSKTVFTDSLITLHKGYERHVFSGESFSIIGAFDQAFGGGDRPALRFAALGEIGPGKMGIEWMPPIELFIDAAAAAKDQPVRYQLLASLRKHCGSVQYRGQIYQCQPENLAIDVTGEGGLADIVQQEWSPKVIRIQFSGACSTEPCSHEDLRPANEVYRNKRAEMYFQSKAALAAGQLRGIDVETAAELCTIEYKEFNDKGIRIPLTIQDKKEYKKKFTKSPDLSDCGIMILEVARLKGFRIIETGHTVHLGEETLEETKKGQTIYANEEFKDEEPAMYQGDGEEEFAENPFAYEEGD